MVVSHPTPVRHLRCLQAVCAFASSRANTQQIGVRLWHAIKAGLARRGVDGAGWGWRIAGCPENDAGPPMGNNSTTNQVHARPADPRTGRSAASPAGSGATAGPEPYAHAQPRD